MGITWADDLKSISMKDLNKFILMYGEYEGYKGNIIVKNTGHELTEYYISCISKLL